ncbi:MAG: MATE family efflux transporter [Clostridia bacterium]|nr:MATE family efflux transporter [Clostridia bacterium]
MTENKMGVEKVGKLIMAMGLPMILSMVLQALYNVVDTMFVINMGEEGALGNLALSAAFPVQIMMIAIGVGSGVGINAMLSKNLGEGNKETVDKIAGNGIFLIAVFYAVFLLFGAFLSKPYMRLMSDNETVVEMGTEYLKICCCISIGSIGFAVAERFLIATGKTLFSMLSQVAGAITNIVLDYVFIYPLQMGIAGAAYATVIGQIVSFLLAMILHYATNKEIGGNPKYIKPEGGIIKNIYRIGFPAFLMQGMLALMMFGVLLIIGTIDDVYTVNLLSGSYGIYYKLMQIALFASFGLSNTLITVTSYNYGMGDGKRVTETIKYGVIDSVVVTAILTVLYQAFAAPISELFALTIEESSIVAKSDILETCRLALHIATIGYVFMGFSVAVQGVLQGFNEVYSPLIISALRLIVLVLPIAFLFTLSFDVSALIWWTFPIAEAVTAVVSYFLLKRSVKKNLGRGQSAPSV